MARAKKTRVKSTARAEKMAARWKDPVYAAKMRDAAKRGAAAANAKRKTSSPPSPRATDPAGPPAPPADPPRTNPDPKAKARPARSWSPGRTWG